MKISTLLILATFAFLGIFQGCGQKKCTQVTIAFVDKSVSQADRSLVVEKLKKRLDRNNVAADVALESDNVLVKMPCGISESGRSFLRSDPFAIYETYDAKSLQAAINRMLAINDSLVQHAPEIAKGYTLRLPRFDEMVDRSTEAGACIGSCKIRYLKEFNELANRSEVKKMLPSNLVFYVGAAEKNASALPIYAIKKPANGVPPIDSRMIAKARTSESQIPGTWDVVIEFGEKYEATWARLTRNNANRFLAIVLSDEVLSCPMVTSEIRGGRASVSAMMKREQAEAIAARIDSSLPVAIQIAEVKAIGEKE